MSFGKLRFPKFGSGFDTMKQVMTQSEKRPYIGVTQGGSSRTNSGAKPAATNGQKRPTKPRSS